MQDWAKFVIGAAATSLLAWATHMVTAEGFAEDLDAHSSAALAEAGVDNVGVHIVRDPVMKRVAVLDGDVDDAVRSQAARIVRQVPGVADVRWLGEEDVAAAGSDAQPAKSAADECQAAIDAALNGRTINFRSGSAYMPPSSVETAQSVATALKGCAGVTIEIAGHSNAGGSAAASQSMSLERANRVKGVMVESGIDAARIITKGYGASQLKVEGTSAEANRANRRVEFVVQDAAAQTAVQPKDGKE